MMRRRSTVRTSRVVQALAVGALVGAGSFALADDEVPGGAAGFPPRLADGWAARSAAPSETFADPSTAAPSETFAHPSAASPSETVHDAPATSTPLPDVVHARPAGDGWGLPIPMVRIRGDHTVVRRGPGDEFALVSVEPKGAEHRVIAKSGDWYNVELSPTTTGWIHASLCEEFEDLSGLEMRPNPRLFSRIGAFSLSGYAGGYSFDRKSNSLALGGRVGYYLLDFVEVEGGVSWTHIHRPAEIVESLFGLSLEAEDFHMLFYHLGVRLELLPGRQMVPYALGGVGASILRGKTESAVHYGGGTMLFVNKTTAVRWELRAYRFEAGFDRSRRVNHNVEFSLGTSVLF